MRSTLFIAACCVLCLSLPSLAGNEQGFTISVKFSKPNVTYWTFLHDRDACLSDATHPGWVTADGHSAVPATPIYDVARFGNCMVAKGYRSDPNGYYAATFQHRMDNSYWLVRL